MPCITDKKTVQLIAQTYCRNGRNKTRAMKEVGYGAGYADSGRGHRMVFGNVRVEQAIEDIDRENEEIKDEAASINDEYVMRKLIKGLRLAESKGDLVAIARFTELIGKTMAMFKDKVVTDPAQPQLMSEAKRRALIEALKIVEARPKLHKDTG